MTIRIVDYNLCSETHELFDVTFFNDKIHTLLTRTPSMVDMWISETEQIHRGDPYSVLVGLDVEWRPSFSRIQNPVAIIQLCVDRRCLIFQLIHAPFIPRSLYDFLRNVDYTFVGVGIDADVEKLSYDYNLEVSKTLDLRCLAARRLGMRELVNGGLKDLAREVLGKVVEKPMNVTLSKWDEAWLTHAQVQYACVDAFLSFEIGRMMLT